MRLRAFVAFVAFYFGLGLDMKTRRKILYIYRPTILQPDRGSE
jgi:hypothetical protein